MSAKTASSSFTGTAAPPDRRRRPSGSSRTSGPPRQSSADTAGGAALARSLAEAIPEKGTPVEQLLDLLFDRVIPKSFNTAGPGYLAYIPGGGIPHAAVADLIADAVNRYVGVFAAAPGLAQIESNVVRWFADLRGFRPRPGGILTSGGSLANFSALVAARRGPAAGEFLSGTLYASDQTHHSVQKAALLAGFPPGNVRAIPTDDAYRIRVPALAEAIAADRAAGRTPFFVVGNAGTTNTGAVDDLAALAEVCARERLWFHVDGAYGGFFLLTEEGRRRMAGIERADSIVLDPHKGLFLPYGTGALLVRDARRCAARTRCPPNTCLRCRRIRTSWTSTCCRPSSRATSAVCASGCP